MFGFSDPTVKMLIQELPNAEKCTSYQWKEFHGSVSAAELSSKEPETNQDEASVSTDVMEIDQPDEGENEEGSSPATGYSEKETTL